ncbi:MAG: methyltransferase domain-containing protein [Burkholderiaceae bacterium]
MSAQIPEAAGTGEDLAAYYAARATEYDAIYARVERQPELERLGSMLCELLHMRSVLEVACGTGYWTQRYAQRARKVLATDVNEAVLAIARDRLSAFPGARVERVDAFALEPCASTRARRSTPPWPCSGGRT